MKRLLIAVGFFAVVGSAQAQLIGFCSTVGPTGPSSCASETTSWLQKLQAADAYIQDTLHLQQTIHILTLATQMSNFISGTANLWPSSHTGWSPLYASNSFGINSGWIAANNSGAGGSLAMGSIMSPLNVSQIPGIPVQFQGNLQMVVGAIERHDGMVQGSMGTVGTYLQRSLNLATNLSRLANSVTSSLSSDLTYAAQMQKMASATMLNTQTNSAGIELQKQMVLNQQATMILQRESIARGLNTQLYTYGSGPQSFSISQDPSAALAGLRIP